VSEPKKSPKKSHRLHEGPGERRPHGNSARQLDRMALLAHQFMTPLSTIATLAQGMMRRAGRLGPDDVRDRSEKIWRASLRLQELIETIMSYTQLNSGALTLNLSLFSLDDLVRRVCSEHRMQAPTRPFQVNLQELPEVFVGDPVLLERALVIVLSNAMKYSPAHEPICITSRKRNGSIVIEVEDRGIGVPEADIPYLTQPFFRARNVKHMPGAGLGLSLVWHILKLHGGNVQVESRERHGTTVRLILPDEPPSDLGADV